MNNKLPHPRKVIIRGRQTCISYIRVDCIYYDEYFSRVLWAHGGGSNKVRSRKEGCHQESDTGLESPPLSGGMGEQGNW